jgi:hypothetical protein
MALISIRKLSYATTRATATVPEEVRGDVLRHMGVEPRYEAGALFEKMSQEHERRKQEASAEPIRGLAHPNLGSFSHSRMVPLEPSPGARAARRLHGER